MKEVMKVFAFIFVLTAMTSLLLLPTSHALSEVAGAPLIMKLGDDKAIDYTVQKILLFIPTASVVSANDIKAFNSISSSFAGYIIYVGHGEESGLRVGQNLVPWAQIRTIIQNSPSSAYMLASCYSKAAQVDGKTTYGFQRQVDVDEAALWAVINYFSYNKQYDKVPAVVQYFTSIIIDKYQHPGKGFTATLDYTDNSYNVDYLWWNKYSDSQLNPVRYTHPDVYNTWGYSVGTETAWTYWSPTIGVNHLKESNLNTHGLAGVFGSLSGLLSSGLGVIFNNFVAAGILATLGFYAAVDWYIIENYVKAEHNDGWEYETMPQEGGCPPWYYEMTFDYKIGSMEWWTFAYYYASPNIMIGWFVPTGNGGQYLGRGGI